MTLQAYKRDQPLIEQYSAATVVGLGATGYSAVRYLRARGLQVTVVDSRLQPPLASKLNENYPEVEVTFGDFELSNLIVAALIVASPGVALSEPALLSARQHGAHIVGDVELFLEENDRPLIAITGSNGKSTVTTLVGEMVEAAGMQACVAGNIGIPVLDALTDAQDYDVSVLELSSFQLETTSSVHAASAAILNVSEDHMDRYDSMGDYVLAKARVLRGATRAILPRHDVQLKQITKSSKVLNFDLDEPTGDAEFGVKRESGKRWLMKGKTRLMELQEVPLTGLHNVKNVLSAFALVDFLDLPIAKLVEATKNFKGLAHRMQTTLVSRGVTWVNDSKATNVGATGTALRNLESSVVWIAGGQGKGADFSELRDSIGDHVERLILFGEDAKQIAGALNGALPIEQVADLQAAVCLANEHAGEGSVVLLSPACASFDMFDSFEQRGQAFAEAVQDLVARGLA